MCLSIEYGIDKGFPNRITLGRTVSFGNQLSSDSGSGSYVNKFFTVTVVKKKTLIKLNTKLYFFANLFFPRLNVQKHVE